ncbi:MAG: hypothetical protein A3K19_31190 [Lentisphaerae bacterium RIFOXYB12_FULL_65_16]|nr:MAG: hypothetical protein A3K18_20480 [Lentisphaerae bacterium RIFOXYA12_64_32]OGV88902.1 MAG: hypothetical protein A3K19_31190 [Lentisphaerae bacterium RIFOXYB12_FULL_65_16]
MDTQGRVRILCVDDEPNLLAGLSRQLRQYYEVRTADGGVAGLKAIQQEGPFAVVISDMRMPAMDGATFLKYARTGAPDTVRVLLTGQADMDSAIAAVNEGNIFRFLTKPCPIDVLLTALKACVEQHRLVTAERVLLEETLRGSVKMLTEVLSLVSPTAFGRAARLQQRVAAIAAQMGIRDRWHIEVAAMVSQIGCVALPPETAEKLAHGQAMSEREQAMVERLPTVAQQLLAHIPRMESVRDILEFQDRRYDGAGAPDGPRKDQLPPGARILRVALDFDTLEAQSVSGDLALSTLRGRAGWYDPAVLAAFEQVQGGSRHAEVRELALADLRPGMVFLEDVRTVSGMVLIAHGQEATVGLIERLRNIASGSSRMREPLRVVLPKTPAPPGA